MQPKFASLTIAALMAAGYAVVTLDAASALSTSDCSNVGGKVVEVSDGRCGASGQYCKMPDGNALCIHVRNIKKDLPQLQPTTPKVQPKVLPKGNIQRAE